MTDNLFICLTKSDKATQKWVDWSDKHQLYFRAKIQLFCYKSAHVFYLFIIQLWLTRVKFYFNVAQFLLSVKNCFFCHFYIISGFSHSKTTNKNSSNS